jgi:hypothetical protein
MSPNKTKRTGRDANCCSSPAHARRLLASARESHNDARDPLNNYAFLAHARSADSLVEGLGEAFIESATSGQGSATQRQHEVSTEEDGGPFLVTLAIDEYAAGMDESNILEAAREPLPTVSSARPDPGPQMYRGRSRRAQR